MLHRFHRPPRRLFDALLVLSFLLPAPTALFGQTAQEVLDAMAERYSERMAGIENYTIVQDVMGFSTTTYFERDESGGFTMQSMQGSAAVQRMPVMDEAQLERMAAASTYEGTEDVGGRSAHVIFVEDIGTLSQPGMEMPQGFEDGTMRMWIDQEWLVPLQVVMDGTMSVEGRTGPVTSTVLLEDYREEQGLLHAFKTTISMEGMTELMDVSEEQLQEMAAAMEQMQEQMASIPQAQRAMMERMLGGQLERMQQMLSSGAMDMVIEVTEVQVNGGPPGD